MSNVTCQVWRLELHDDVTNAFKQYTGILSANGHALFGYGRIGAGYQWSSKGRSASAAPIVAKQLQSKRLKGYDDKWAADIVVPEEWLEDGGTPALQTAIERARLEGATRFETGVDDAPSGPLAPLVAQARSVMSKVAANPDEGVREYGALVDAVDAARADLDTASNYIDTLRLMLAGAGKGAA